ncbi:MAG TPA: hypothetical protein VGS19_16435, partial [Streptosporangiaceae bacterium]|nr:hypothetical protein [Streptosporangiaceae bacterium]
RVQAHLLCGLATALRCQAILLPVRSGSRIHLFGFESDIERAEVLYTSVLVQMWQGLAATQVPVLNQNPRAWRRSWLLGFAAGVVSRVREAEEAAARSADVPVTTGGRCAALVLADRRQTVRRAVQHAYPVTRTARVTYTGNGYGSGYSKGQQADIGTTRLGGWAGRALTGTR